MLDQARTAHAAAPADEGLALDYAGLLATTRGLAAAVLYDSIVHAPGATPAAFHAVVAFWTGAGRPDVAGRLADSGLAHHPDDGELWLAKGRLAAAAGRWPEAVAALRRAQALVPDQEVAELPLVDAEAGAGDTAAAVAVTRALEARGVSRVSLLVAAGRAAELGAAGAAVADSIYRGLLARAPDDVSALDAAAALAAARGDTARAIRLYRHDLMVDSSGPWAPAALLDLEHPAPARARRLLLTAEWRALAALGREEAGGAALTPEAAAGRRRLLALTRAVLDTVVFHTAWGSGELDQLRRAYPGSALLDRYAAELAARRGDDSAAVARYDALVRAAPADTAAQRGRAAALERLGRTADARAAFAVVLDLDPGDTTAYRALVRLDEHAGALDDLLAQIRRLRVRLPASRPLAEHEIEVLQRLGRLAEAQAVARHLEENHS